MKFLDNHNSPSGYIFIQVPENSFLNKQALDCNLNFRLKNGVHVDQEL